MRITIPQPLIADAERVERTQNDIVDTLAAIRGVTATASGSTMPMEGFPADWDAVTVEGQQAPGGEVPPMRMFKYVSPGLFQVAGTRLIAGRDYTWTDLYARRNFVIVSENLARELWSTPAGAIGKTSQTASRGLIPMVEARWRGSDGPVTMACTRQAPTAH
jgi:hypothetical protein